MVDRRYKKSLGQHFLTDKNVVGKIVQNCPNLNHNIVIEVGPGSGNLTAQLLLHCKKLIAIEKDDSLNNDLQELVRKWGGGRANDLTDIQLAGKFIYYLADALKFDFKELFKQVAQQQVKGESTSLAVIANLPYNVGTELYTRWVQLGSYLDYMVLMFQKEVAQRITAKVNENHYGRLALFTQLYGIPEYLFTVQKGCFYPQPAVDSAVIRFTPHNKYDSVNKNMVMKVVKQAFSQRRKMIKVSLKAYNLNFGQLNIDPTSRPENLSLLDFIKISQHLN